MVARPRQRGPPRTGSDLCSRHRGESGGRPLVGCTPRSAGRLFGGPPSRHEVGCTYLHWNRSLPWPGGRLRAHCARVGGGTTLKSPPAVRDVYTDAASQCKPRRSKAGAPTMHPRRCVWPPVRRGRDGRAGSGHPRMGALARPFVAMLVEPYSPNTQSRVNMACSVHARYLSVSHLWSRPSETLSSRNVCRPSPPPPHPSSRLF